ncbi:response regulator transcription factor [Novosphingobium sp. ST904]|uniref:response regulator transcription factor n=1 Tax=Novosphingobium sp. ST904 TaxID=1684385 RepID=UPI0006C86CE4|nr:response regulator transcription factor [Novosphingobium sp. ST904]KPH64091.1 LuxR family transcriptional regulator [Novosphingobium sp. ST904]TCM32439.1 LuxR family two component transcriptional regulator [Novosphingobium sp. ST904]
MISMLPEETAPLVLIVDDDEAVRTAIGELMLSVGIEAACYGSTRELIESPLLDRSCCLILDVRMPGSSGLDLQRYLASAGIVKPIVFLTGHGDIPMSVQAMKAGAVDFLTKPVRDQTLLDAVVKGIERDAAVRQDGRIVARHAENFSTLTPRETQVMRAVASGRLNKQIAYDLGIAEITVKLHRSNAMKKMNAVSVGELIRAWEKLPVVLRESASA